jgi:hypothetical protein
VLFHIQLPTNSFRFTSINLLSTWMEWFSNGWWCIGGGGRLLGNIIWRQNWV